MHFTAKPIIGLLDVVLLDDGREATIVEKLSETAFLVDVGSSPEDWDTIFVTLDHVENVVWSYKEERS